MPPPARAAAGELIRRRLLRGGARRRVAEPRRNAHECDGVLILPQDASRGEAAADSFVPCRQPSPDREGPANRQHSEQHRIPRLTVKPQVRLVGDERGESHDKARIEQQPIPPARRDDERGHGKDPDHDVREPVEHRVVHRRRYKRELQVERAVDAEHGGCREDAILVAGIFHSLLSVLQMRGDEASAEQGRREEPLCDR